MTAAATESTVGFSFAAFFFFSDSSCISAELFFEQPLRFPTRQAFVHHSTGTPICFRARCANRSGFLGHFAPRSIEKQRQAHHDLLHFVFAHEFLASAACLHCD